MPLSVQKRSGMVVDFNPSKIGEAIVKASNACSVVIPDDEIEQMISNIIREIDAIGEKVDVETIQDKVVEQLIFFHYTKVALTYTRYRERRAISRESKIDALEIINDYLDTNSPKHDMAVHENASTGFSLQGMHQYIFESVVNRKWLSLLSDDIKTAHEKGLIHIHDLGYLGPYCCGWDLKQLIEEGFNGVEDKIYSNPPTHFGSALGQSFNFIYTLQGESAGAQAFSNFNTLLAPFVAVDELTYKQVKQHIQDFIYNLNIPTRVGFQSPFSNITLDLDVTKTKLADEVIIIGGKLDDQGRTYKQFQKEAQWINQAIVEIMEGGDGKGAPFTYPIITFNVTKDFPWDTKFGEILLKATAKYGNFYWANYINSDFTSEDFTSMCCRLRIDRKKIQKHLTESTGGLETEEYEKTHQKGHGFFGAAPNTGSVGVVTMNLPAMMTIAKEQTKFDSSLDEQWVVFKKIIKQYMDISAEALHKKRKHIELLCEDGLYPYIKHYLRHIKARTGHYFTQHFSTICTNGFHETLIVFGFEQGMDDPNAWPYAEDLLKYMNEYTVELQKKYNVLFNLEQAPAESAGIKLCQKSGIDPSNNGYYTNSTWFPADSKTDMFKQIHVQSKLNEFYTGGSALHIYTDVDLLPVYKELRKLIVYTFEETKLPYLTISPVFSMCDVHGRFPGIIEKCPTCGKKTMSYLRIVGYLRALQNFNKGRKKEALKRRHWKFNEKLSSLKTNL